MNALEAVIVGTFVGVAIIVTIGWGVVAFLMLVVRFLG